MWQQNSTTCIRSSTRLSFRWLQTSETRIHSLTLVLRLPQQEMSSRCQSLQKGVEWCVCVCGDAGKERGEGREEGRKTFGPLRLRALRSNLLFMHSSHHEQLSRTRSCVDRERFPKGVFLTTNKVSIKSDFHDMTWWLCLSDTGKTPEETVESHVENQTHISVRRMCSLTPSIFGHFSRDVRIPEVLSWHHDNQSSASRCRIQGNEAWPQSNASGQRKTRLHAGSGPDWTGDALVADPAGPSRKCTSSKAAAPRLRESSATVSSICDVQMWGGDWRDRTRLAKSSRNPSWMGVGTTRRYRTAVNHWTKKSGSSREQEFSPQVKKSKWNMSILGKWIFFCVFFCIMTLDFEMRKILRNKKIQNTETFQNTWKWTEKTTEKYIRFVLWKSNRQVSL